MKSGATIAALLCLLISLSGCAWIGMAAAGFMGTVGGNLMSDHLEGKTNNDKRAD